MKTVVVGIRISPATRAKLKAAAAADHRSVNQYVAALIARAIGGGK